VFHYVRREKKYAIPQHLKKSNIAKLRIGYVNIILVRFPRIRNRIRKHYISPIPKNTKCQLAVVNNMPSVFFGTANAHFRGGIK
jgi:hypothetical protein